MKSIGMILLGSVVIILHFSFNIHTQWVDCFQLVLPTALRTISAISSPIRGTMRLPATLSIITIENYALNEEFLIQSIIQLENPPKAKKAIKGRLINFEAKNRHNSLYNRCFPD